MYNDYYAKQLGGGSDMPYFAGSRYQRGHGLGSMFAKLFRSFIVPTFGRVLKQEVPKRLLSFGTDVLQDVSKGNSFRSSLKTRGLDHLKGVAQDFIQPLSETFSSSSPPGQQVQQGQGRRRHRSSKRLTQQPRKLRSAKRTKQQPRKSRPAKRTKSDIFS